MTADYLGGAVSTDLVVALYYTSNFHCVMETVPYLDNPFIYRVFVCFLLYLTMLFQLHGLHSVQRHDYFKTMVQVVQILCRGLCTVEHLCVTAD
jgi:fumarate reductase subunit D